MTSYKWRCLACGWFTPPVVLTEGQDPPVEAADVYCSLCRKKTPHRVHGAPERRSHKRVPK